MSYSIDYPMKLQHPHPEQSPPSTAGLWRPFFRRRRWHPLEPVILGNDSKPTFEPFDLGAYSGEYVVNQVFDGDIIVDNISEQCNVSLESRHGSITITHKIEQSAQVNLKAGRTVTIGESIDQHSIVQITARGDVTIGQTINHNSQVTITSVAGKIDIGLTVDNYSKAKLTAGTTVHVGQDIGQHSTVIITAPGDVTIGRDINRHAAVDIISINGAISVGRMVKEDVIASLTAGKTVHIGENLDQYCQVTVLAQSDVAIGHKIDHHSAAEITSVEGSINIGQGLSGRATATLIALNGSINIGGSVDRDSTVNWNAQYFNCPHDDGTINHICSSHTAPLETPYLSYFHRSRDYVRRIIERFLIPLTTRRVAPERTGKGEAVNHLKISPTDHRQELF
jgi:hypothetical protein